MVHRVHDVTGLPPRPWSRRRFLKASSLATLGAMVPTAGWAAASRPRPAAQRTSQQATSTVRLLGQAGSGEERPITDFAVEFKDQTGTEVLIAPQPWQDLMTKIQADLASGAPTFDVFWSDLEFAYTVWPNLIPLNDLIAETNYPMDGFFPSVVAYGLNIGGQGDKRFGLPIMTDTQMVWHRPSLTGDTFPTTWDDFDALCRDLTAGDQYALGNAGDVPQGIGRFLSRYWSIPGTRLFDADWNPLINGEEGIAALEMYKRQALAYSPPGFQAWNYTDALNAFLVGQVAIHEGWPEAALPSLNNPDQSTLGEDWYAAAYPEGGSTQLVQHNLILFNHASDPRAAFDFMAYATNREQAARIINEYFVDTPRQDVWEQVLPTNAVAQKFYPGWSQAMSVARPFGRGLPQWVELFIAIGEAVTNVLAETQTVKEALDTTAARWKTSIDQARPDFPYEELAGI
ncbi:MAG: extracellular solute-binding protein [Chloroflexi bacterium]|nr:extracellular solute-binding protein [Chloroflexota bacterium]